METFLVVIVILLAILVLLFMGIVIFLVYKIYLGQNLVMADKKIEREAKDVIEQARVQSDGNIGQYCIDHPELPAKGICSLTDEAYCELCIAKENDIRISRKYLNLLLDSEWENTFFIPNEKVGADILNDLYRIKHEIWKNMDIPIITQQQFKINIENDKVESYTMVMGRKSDRDFLTSKLEFLKTINGTH